MREAQRLYELQATDLEVEERGRRLAEVEASLGESESLLRARAAFHAAEALLHEQETELQDLDLQLGELADKIKQVEARLYGGLVRSPKELSALDQDLKSLRQQCSGLEDRELEQMMALDDSRTARRARQAEYAQIESTCREEQAQLEAEREALTERLATLRAHRQELAEALSSDCLTSYEDLRRTRRGRAVARVEQNTCQGCRIALPSHEVQRARLSPNLVFCSSCGRILWAAR